MLYVNILSMLDQPDLTKLEKKIGTFSYINYGRTTLSKYLVLLRRAFLPCRTKSDIFMIIYIDLRI